MRWRGRARPRERRAGGAGRSWGGEAVSPPQVGGGDGGEGAPPEGAGAVSMTTRYPAGGDSELSRPEPPGLGPSVRERSWWGERDRGNSRKKG